MNKKKKLDKIIKNIKEIKIQGAKNIAKAALKAYSLDPSKRTIKRLLSTRPTEPMMQNVLNLAEQEMPLKQIRLHFSLAQQEINKAVFKLIKSNNVIFTHCHSTNVIHALVYSKKKAKKFEVYNSETRPLFQGRKTAKDLKKAKIKVTMFIDSAMNVALSKELGTKKVSKVFIGADALIKQGVINKIGSETLAILAKKHKIPFYVVADSWKFSNHKIPIENRKLNEVWDKAPKKIKIKNPAFEFVPKKYLAGIITEYGLLSYEQFLKKAC